MSKISCIGRCEGCDRPRQLDDGVCGECLNAPNRGRVWAKRAHRCRTDPDFAKEVYESITTASGKKMFMAMFGVPDGSSSPENIPVPTGTYPPVHTGGHMGGLRLVKP